jgi:hypothetical protein
MKVNKTQWWWLWNWKLLLTAREEFFFKNLRIDNTGIFSAAFSPLLKLGSKLSMYHVQYLLYGFAKPRHRLSGGIYGVLLRGCPRIIYVRESVSVSLLGLQLHFQTHCSPVARRTHTIRPKRLLRWTLLEISHRAVARIKSRPCQPLLNPTIPTLQSHQHR